MIVRAIYSSALLCTSRGKILASVDNEGAWIIVSLWLGHFVSARIWNYTPDEAGYDGSCSFSYYKNTSAASLRGDDDGIPVVPIDCAVAYGHRDAECSTVTIDNHVVGSEDDWLTFFWAITTDETAPGEINVSTILGWYSAALAKLPAYRDANMTYDLLRAEADATLAQWLDDTAADHAVY